MYKLKTNFKKLDKIAYTNSDNKLAEILRKEERKLFDKIRIYEQSYINFSILVLADKYINLTTNN